MSCSEKGAANGVNFFIDLVFSILEFDRSFLSLSLLLFLHESGLEFGAVIKAVFATMFSLLGDLSYF